MRHGDAFIHWLWVCVPSGAPRRYAGFESCPRLDNRSLLSPENRSQLLDYSNNFNGDVPRVLLMPLSPNLLELGFEEPDDCFLVV